MPPLAACWGGLVWLSGLSRQLLQLAVPLQGPVWTLVFCVSRLELELFLFLVFIMPFELVVLTCTGLVPSLYLFK